MTGIIQSALSSLLRHQAPRCCRSVLGLQNVCRSRTFHQQADRSVMTVLNDDGNLGLLINSYSNIGFRLNNGMFAVGPIAIFPKTVLSWNVGSSQDINEASLSLFTILEPKLDILVIGVGDPGQKVNLEVIRYLRSMKIGVEILPTEKACATFNFLNVENRCIAGALIPPTRVMPTESEHFQQRLDSTNKDNSLGRFLSD